ncbi:hypothetical protein BS47DRAFT_1399801 [Hydnum rufescens UP504]|uniref:Uncharacterized protein n=1 Tax=Hydnum rufescens UP504 TaxID=1448309 RepID=A0A9P6AIS5_9AGAM|nr:hypothetical protein BS47DRAFT_1399801 [Hydnum rufescens UP504]
MSFVLHLFRERYEGMEEPWDNTAKETGDRVLVDAFNTCATTLRSAPTGGDMELQEFSGCTNLLRLNQNATDRAGIDESNRRQPMEAVSLTGRQKEIRARRDRDPEWTTVLQFGQESILEVESMGGTQGCLASGGLNEGPTAKSSRAQ